MKLDYSLYYCVKIEVVDKLITFLTFTKYVKLREIKHSKLTIKLSSTRTKQNIIYKCFVVDDFQSSTTFLWALI